MANYGPVSGGFTLSGAATKADHRSWMNAAPAAVEAIMQVLTHVEIHQYNDPEILEFLNEHRVEYRLVGDHLFVIRERGCDVAAGPGDRLMIAADGEVEVHRGDYAQRAQRAILKARQARRQLRHGLRGTGDAEKRAAEAHRESAQQTLTEVPESQTERWMRRVEAEARDRLKRAIHHVGHKD